MFRILLIALCFTTSNLVVAQSDFNLSNKSKFSYRAKDAFKQNVTSSLSIVEGYDAVIELIVTTQKSSAKKIEGIETKELSKSKLTCLINNRITQVDTVFRFETDLALTSNQDADVALMEQFAKSASWKKFLDLLALNVKSSKADCGAYKKTIESTSATDVNAAMRMVAYLEVNKLCTAELGTTYKSILEKYQKQECENILFNAKTLIASGNDYNILKATNLIMTVPPTASCRTEALKVIEELNTKTNLSAKSRTDIDQYNQMVSNNDMNQWYRMVLEKN